MRKRYQPPDITEYGNVSRVTHGTDQCHWEFGNLHRTLVCVDSQDILEPYRKVFWYDCEALQC